MKKRRIKTEWASLCLARDASAIVCVQSNGGPCCMRFNSLEQLKQAIDRRKMLVKKWAIAVPRSSCILKPLALPASDLAEAAKMIEFELPSLVPLPPEEIVWGCMLLSKQDNMLNVLACILKLNALNRHLEPYRAAGIEPHRVTLEPLAMQNWFGTKNPAESGPIISAFVNKRRCTVLTSIDSRLHRVDERTLSDTDIAAASREIVQEILNQREGLPPLQRRKTRTLLAGTEEYVSGIKSLFRSIEADPAITNNIGVVANPRIISYEDREHEDDGNSFSYEAVVATGLFGLVKDSKFLFSNLLPQEYLRRSEKKILLFNYLFIGSAFLLLILLLWLCLWAMNRRIESKSRIIESRIAPIEDMASSVDKKRQRVKAIQDQLSNRDLITRIFQELYKYTPKNISINHLVFLQKQGRASIEIKGQADLLSNAFEYTEAMREAPLLNRMQIVNAQQIPRPGGSVVEFKAQCVIKND